MISKITHSILLFLLKLRKDNIFVLNDYQNNKNLNVCEVLILKNLNN